MCRRWHGHTGAYAAVDRADLVLTEARGLAWFTSSEGVRRGFCRACGSCLFFDDASDAKIGYVPGALDAPTGLRSKAHIFAASKGDYYELADDGLIRIDGAPR
jgi:hypothetical protein